MTLSRLFQMNLWREFHSLTADKVIQELRDLGIFTYSLPYIFAYAFCIPSLCTKNDLKTILKSLVDDKLRIKTEVLNCQTRDDVYWNEVEIAMGIIIAILLLFVVVGTLSDVCLSIVQNSEKESKPNDTKSNQNTFLTLMQCFSAKKNANQLLPSKNYSQLRPLCGIKVFTMAWIILVHVYVYSFFDFPAAVDDKFNTLKMFYNQMLFHGIWNGTYTVDAFFLTTALIVSLNFLKRKEVIKKQNIFIFFLSSFLFRYLRLLPGVLGTICLKLLSPAIIGTPNKRPEISNYECRNYWWRNVLAINNWFSVRETCVPFTWYVCTDLQLLAIFLIPLYVFVRCPRKGALLLLLISLPSYGIAYYLLFVKSDIYDGVFNFQVDPLKLADIFIEDLQGNPVTHIPMFALGIGLGYLIMYHKQDIKLHRGVQFVLWIITAGTFLSIIWSTYTWKQYSFKPPKSHVISRKICARTAWTLAVCWVVYACVSGRGGIVNTILSWRILVPLSKLSYSLYLSHSFIVSGRILYRRNTFSLTHSNLISEFIVSMFCCIVFAFIFYLIFEAPFANIVTLLFKPFFGAERAESKDAEKPSHVQTKTAEENGTAPFRVETCVSSNETIPQKQI